MFEDKRDDYSDVMTLEEFFECENTGMITPDDGIGYYGSDTHYTYDVSIWRHLPPEGATHVHWYNK